MRESDSNRIGFRTEASNSNTPNGDSESEDQTRTYLCIRCGKVFSNPLELTLRSKSASETYDACPYCFSKINVSSNLKKDMTERTENTENATLTSCMHSMGYLKTHPKGTPYPDECLICPAIMECVVGRSHEENRRT